MSYGASSPVPYSLCSRWKLAHGVTVKATTSDSSIATGTLNAMGAM